MTKIVSSSLPHAIPHSDIRDVQLQRKIMLLVENIKALQTRLVNAEKAVVELQRR